MTEKRKSQKILTGLEAWFASFALTRICGLETTSIFTLLFFILCFQVFLLEAEKEREGLLSKDGRSMVLSLSAGRRRTASFALGLFYTLLCLARMHDVLTEGLSNPLFWAVSLLMSAAGLFFLFFYCVRLLFFYLEKRALRIGSFKNPHLQDQKLPLQMKLLLPVILFGCWLPWFLYNFPGVMTPDSLSQYSQAMGLSAYSDHHPFAHTLLIRLFLSLGMALFHNVYAAIACYTIFQMVLMDLILCYCLCVLYRYGAGKKLCLLFLIFYACVPYNGSFAVTMWKDVPFSGFLLLFALSIWQLLHLTASNDSRNGDRQASRTVSVLKKKPILLLRLLLSGLLVCLFRSNGLYVFLLTAPFLLLIVRREWKLLLTGVLAVAALALCIKGPVYDVLGVAKPAFSESLSIPAQQIARVVYEGRKLTQEQIDLLDRTVDYASIADYYQPELSDPVKALIQYGDPEYLETHKAEYLKLWLQLGLRYPFDYINAFIDQTWGYWFPGEPGLTVNEGISPNDLGLTSQSVLSGTAAWKVVEILNKLYTIFPLYGLLYSIGSFTWAALFLCANCALNGRRRNCLLFVPYFALILTLCLAAPVAGDLRYAYPLILAMPLLLCAGLEVPDRAAGQRA